MRHEMVRNILADPTFAAEIENVATIEELQAAFQARGAVLTLEEVEEICVAVAKTGDELDETSLESAAGGIAPWLAAKVAVAVAIGVTAAYYKIKSIKK